MTRRRKPAATQRPAHGTLKLVPKPSTSVVSLARVAEARRRIAAGWYDRSEVREGLVDAMLEEMRSR
jgi:hypothetical protein